MAIDTQNKRRSTLDTKAISRILPVPDAAITAPDRAHMWLYSGIPISAATTGVFVDPKVIALGGRMDLWPLGTTTGGLG